MFDSNDYFRSMGHAKVLYLFPRLCFSVFRHETRQVEVITALSLSPAYENFYSPSFRPWKLRYKVLPFNSFAVPFIAYIIDSDQPAFISRGAMRY